MKTDQDWPLSEPDTLLEDMLAWFQPLDGWLELVEQRLATMRPVQASDREHPLVLRALVKYSTLLGVLHALVRARDQVQRLKDGKQP